MSISEYGRNCRPAVARFLEAIGLDATYERASGDSLWRRQGGSNVEVLDLVGGYGANLFGHYHPELLSEYRCLLERQVPVLAQASSRTGAGRLAQALRAKLGDYLVIFTNSGTETVEAAMKHAHLENGRKRFWAVRGAFHGKTSGSIQMTETYCAPYRDLGPEVRFLDPFDPDDWASAEAEAGTVCAAFVEPIAGEGGIHPLPKEFIHWLSDCSRRHGFPFVADEIQTGMGRTGTFLAIERYGIQPDYICLSKALGGGLVKIGALLIAKKRFIEEFSLKHTSTFAEDDISCFVALKALEILDRDRLPEACDETGRWFLDELDRLCEEFPEQLVEARGAGLMVGLELRDQSDSSSNGLRMLSQQSYLGYVCAAYLLNTHKIRVMPTLSNPFTLRFEPSAYISEEQLQRLLDALTTMCQALRNADFGHLASYQVGRSLMPVRDYRNGHHWHRQAPATPQRVGFIGHLLMPSHAALWDPSLAVLSDQELERLMCKPSRVLKPSLFEQVHVKSITGDVVHFSYYGIDLTPSQFMQAMRSRDLDWVEEKIDEAVTMALEDGCQVAGLGGYTSIISGNCRRIRINGIGLTSGNALTVGVGLSVLKKAACARGIPLRKCRVAVVGATGNIGSTYAAMIAEEAAEVLLVARDIRSPRIEQVYKEIRAANPDAVINITDDFYQLRNCQLIVSASNSPAPLIFPEHLPEGPCVICDIAAPGDVSPEVKEQRPDILVLEGGAIKLPCNPDFQIAGLPLPPGQTYACAAETILMGLERETGHGTYGAVTVPRVRKVLEAAEKHGFEPWQLVSTPHF